MSATADIRGDTRRPEVKRLVEHLSGICAVCGYEGRVYAIQGVLVCFEHRYLKRLQEGERKTAP